MLHHNLLVFLIKQTPVVRLERLRSCWRILVSAFRFSGKKNGPEEQKSTNSKPSQEIIYIPSSSFQSKIKKGVPIRSIRLNTFAPYKGM
jgi:hypothetical protein